ncbi:hypothetical protein K1719_024549 [Acacia pycnantha]|nr:hypothetical protein K1719_024549 [Acacia pycnantha]
MTDQGYTSSSHVARGPNKHVGFVFDIDCRLGDTVRDKRHVVASETLCFCSSLLPKSYSEARREPVSIIQEFAKEKTWKKNDVGLFPVDPLSGEDKLKSLYF